MHAEICMLDRTQANNQLFKAQIRTRCQDYLANTLISKMAYKVKERKTKQNNFMNILCYRLTDFFMTYHMSFKDTQGIKNGHAKNAFFEPCE